MKSRTVAVVAALVALATGVAVIPSRLDAATTPWTQRSAQRSAQRSPQVPAPRSAQVPVQRSASRGGTAVLVSVKVTMTTDEPSSVDRDPMHSAGRRRFRSCKNPGPGTSAYSLMGSRVNGPTTAHLNPARGPAGAASAFQAAFGAWAGADSRAPTISVVSDSSVTSPRADHTYELMFAPIGPRNLGVTYTWSWGNGVYESDVVFNSNIPWFLAPDEGDGCYEGVAQFDLQNAATHEFGHVYGLDHVTSAYNTMAPTVTLGETYKRSLASGDALGLQHIY